MEPAEMLGCLQRLKDNGKIADAYSGTGDFSADGQVLMDFCEFFNERRETLPLWAEAFMQVHGWQFEAFHEGPITYYENFYGESDYPTIMKTAKFLKDNGYTEIAQVYVSAAVDCQRYEYPQESLHLLDQVEKWLDDNTGAVFHFYTDILERHRAEILAM